MPWDVEHRVFAVRRYYVNAESVERTQQDFKHYFKIDRHGDVPDRYTILRWVKGSSEIGNILNKKVVKTSVRFSEHVEKVPVSRYNLRNTTFSDTQSRPATFPQSRQRHRGSLKNNLNM